MSRLERIVGEFGGVLMDGGRRALIAGPDHSPRDRSVALMETDDGRILIHCFSPKDDWRRVRRALADRGLLEDKPANANSPPISRQPTSVQRADEDRIERARRWWSAAHPIGGTPAESYLRRRAINASAWNSDAFRFHPRVTSFDDRKRRPALLAALRDADGAIQGVQVTLLSEYEAVKADIATPRRVIGKLLGGAVCLSDPSSVLIVAEGVETALSAAARFERPAWALLTADNLAQFTPPACLRRLIVAQDNDAAGDAAANALALRLSPDLNVTIETPPQGFNDWNDWAREQAQPK